MGPPCPLALSRLPVLSSSALQRALQLPSSPALPRRSLSLFSSGPPDPYRYRVTITPHAPPEELLPSGKRKPGLRQWSWLFLMISANAFLLKFLLDRMDERQLQALEKDRQTLVAEGAAIRKALQLARKEWLKADVQEKQQALMMLGESTEIKEKMAVLRTRAEELRDQWVERDVKEKAIVLFTPDERATLTKERTQLETRVQEHKATASNESTDDSLSPATSPHPPADGAVDVPEVESAATLAARIAEIDERLSGDVRATEIKKTLLREKISLIQDAKVNNEEAGTLRSEWADKDASEKARRLHLKHEKSLLGDQAREYGSRLDEIEKRWQILKVKIAEAKGTTAPVADLPDFSDPDGQELSTSEEGGKVEVATGRADEGSKDGE